jgi:hypothetical protein
MSSEKTTTLQLDRERQIIEIREASQSNSVYFSIQTDEKPFEFAIVDKKTLNSNDFSYRKAYDGYASGTVTDYTYPIFLIIKSNQDCEAEISFSPIKKKIDNVSSLRNLAQSNTLATEDESSKAESEKSVPFYKNKWFLIATAVLLIIVGYYLYKKFTKPASADTSGNKSTKSPESSVASAIASGSEQISSDSFGF